MTDLIKIILRALLILSIYLILPILLILAPENARIEPIIVISAVYIVFVFVILFITQPSDFLPTVYNREELLLSEKIYVNNTAPGLLYYKIVDWIRNMDAIIIDEEFPKRIIAEHSKLYETEIYTERYAHKKIELNIEKDEKSFIVQLLIYVKTSKSGIEVSPERRLWWTSIIEDLRFYIGGEFDEEVKKEYQAINKKKQMMLRNQLLLQLGGMLVGLLIVFYPDIDLLFKAPFIIIVFSLPMRIIDTYDKIKYLQRRQ